MEEHSGVGIHRTSSSGQPLHGPSHGVEVLVEAAGHEIVQLHTETSGSGRSVKALSAGHKERPRSMARGRVMITGDGSASDSSVVLVGFSLAFQPVAQLAEKGFNLRGESSCGTALLRGG